MERTPKRAGRHPETKNTVLVVDANNVCHIALHSMGELSFHDKRTGVIFGFFFRLLKLWEEFGSNRFVFCWDSRKRFRTHLYPEYKSNRQGVLPPEDWEAVHRQMTELRETVLPEFGFANSFLSTGYEADDLIASVILQYKEPEFGVISTDKDLYQILAVHACRFIYNTVSGKRMTRELFEETYGIPTHEWKRVKSICGDKSDFIAGVPGVGEKSAIDYVLGKLKGKRLADVQAASAIIKRNLRLVELPLHWEGSPIILPPSLRADALNLDRMVDTFDAHGFRSFLKDAKFAKWKKFVNA